MAPGQPDSEKPEESPEPHMEEHEDSNQNTPEKQSDGPEASQMVELAEE